MPPFLVALTPILWGTTYIITGKYLSDWPALWLSVLRALPPGLLLLAIRPGWVSRAQLPFLLLISFLYIGAFFPLLFLSALRLPGAVAGTLAATFPLVLLLLQWLVLKIRPTKVALCFACMGLAGVMCLLQPDQQLDWIGVAASLGSVILLGVCSLLMQRYPWQGDLINFTGWQLTIGGCMIIPLAVFIQGMPMLPANADEWFGLSWLMLLNSALAYVLWIWGMTHLPLNRLGLISLLNPLTAVLAGSFLMKEWLSSMQWLGVFLVFSALILDIGIKQKKCSKIMNTKNVKAA